MGKKGSWFSAIKKVFTNSSKEKRVDGADDKKSSSKEKKKGKGTFRPLFREPSSIEKILGEADQLLIRPPPTSSQRPKSPPPFALRPVSPRVSSPKAASSHRASSPKSSSPRAPSPKAPSPRVTSPRADSPKAAPSRTFSTGPVSPKAVTPSTSFATSSKATAPSKVSSVPSKAAAPLKAPPPKVTQSKKEIKYVQRLEPTLRDQQLSATKIQAACRGYMARRSFRALRGLVRLQGVVKGQNVKRQTVNAMKQMQLLVRVQTQIQYRRIQMLESQALQNQAFNNDNEAKSTLSKWTNQLSEAGQNENWDDSVLTKEEADERLRKRVEAVIKRERAMAYAYSNQLWKSAPKSAQNSSDVRSNGFPWWWNWLERQLPRSGASRSQTPTRTVTLTPPRPNSDFKTSPFHRNNLGNLMFDNHESVTPRSARSTAPFKSKPFHTTPNRTSPLASSLSYTKFSKPRASAANSGYDTPLKDDDSLVSCPPFSVPNYMTPTASASAKAKSRAYSNPRERFPGTPGSSDSKRRFSFPLTPSVASFKWNKGSNRETASQIGSEKRDDSRSIGDFSIDSTVSMPAGLGGRKPFNRFV